MSLSIFVCETLELSSVSSLPGSCYLQGYKVLPAHYPVVGAALLKTLKAGLGTSHLLQIGHGPEHAKFHALRNLSSFDQFAEHA